MTREYGGPVKPVKVVTDAELYDNGGIYKLIGQKIALKVSNYDALTGLQRLQGGASIPVYPITQAQVDSGEYKLLGGAAQPVIEITKLAADFEATKKTYGQAAIPVLVVSGAAMGGGAAVPAWTPDSPTTDGGALPHTYFDLETGLYQDSAKTTPVASDADPVGAEVNQGSDTYDVVQATADNRPLYKTNVVNGKPALLFDGTNDFLKGAFGGGAISQPFTVFVAAQLDATAVNDGVNRRILDGDDATNAMMLYQRGAGTPDDWSMFAGVVLSGGASDSDWHVWCAVFNGASSQVWLDGISEASGDAGTQTPDGATFGARNTGGDLWKGYEGKRLIYPGNISTADKNQVGQFLADFYGLAWTDINP